MHYQTTSQGQGHACPGLLRGARTPCLATEMCWRVPCRTWFGGMISRGQRGPTAGTPHRWHCAIAMRARCLIGIAASRSNKRPGRPGTAAARWCLRWARREPDRRHVRLCYFSNLKRARPDDRARARRLDPTATRAARPLRQSGARGGPAPPASAGLRAATARQRRRSPTHNMHNRTHVHALNCINRAWRPGRTAPSNHDLADHNNQNADPRQQHTTRTRSHVCQSRAVRMRWTSRQQSQKRSFATRGAQRATSHRPWRRPPPALCSIRASAEQTPPLFRDALALPQYLPAPAAGVLDSSRILRQ